MLLLNCVCSVFTSSAELYEEQMDEDSGAEGVESAPKEPTMFDELLKKLGSRNVSVARR